MLKKLMKYELMATGRVFLPLFAALLVLSGVNKLLSLLPVEAPQVIGTIVSVILIVGIMVLTFVITLQRFRSNLLSGEGYLMMTLPVRTDALILSKMFTAAIWSLASVIIVTVSSLIMSMSAVNYRDLIDFFRMVGYYITAPAAEIAVYVVEGILLFALSMFSGILTLYACMGLSMLVNKRRGLFTFGAFIVISTVLQTLFSIGVTLTAMLSISLGLDLSNFSLFGQIQIIAGAAIIIEAGLCAVFYFTTRHMLKNRLNLQ